MSSLVDFRFSSKMDLNFGDFGVVHSLAALLSVEAALTLNVSVDHVDDLVHGSGVHSLQTREGKRNTKHRLEPH